ncbi:MAG: ATP-binding protein [Paracoccaceae bacterium]
MPDRIRRKWRPPLLLVLGGALAAVLAAGLTGILALPLLAPVVGMRIAAAIVGATVLAATALLAFLLWRLLLGPVTALADRAHRLREGDAEALRPLAHYGTPELRDLGESVLGMAAALQNREATVRAYTDHVTHELKAPITAIRGAAELLSAEVSAGDRRLVDAILTSAARMETLLAAARQVAAAREPAARGKTTLQAVLGPLATGHPALTIRAEGQDIGLPVTPESLGAALGHLAGNAAEAGARNLSLKAEDAPRGTTLLVGDDGPGIAEGNRERLFRPFFTTRREAGGTGMGLAIAQSLLAAQGATLALEDRSPGAWFRITF